MTKLFSDAGRKWAGSDHGRWEPLPSLVQLREEAIHADAELRVEEWARDWEIIENHVRSGDFTITKQTAELIVCARTAPRGPNRARLMETIGEHILLDLRESLLREAVTQIEREEAQRP